jgi:glutathione synthase/RimK-type ligase-like ATP-grasp enzyme
MNPGQTMAILFVDGVNDQSQVGITLNDKGEVGYLIDGNCSVHSRLPLRQDVAASLMIFGKGVKQRSVEFRKRPSLIFNQIADADSHRGALERCVELCEQVNTTVINHPSKVLRTSRDQVSQKLQGIPGVIMPRTQCFQPSSPDEVFSRATAERFEFPFIIRVAGLHGGQSMIKVNSREDYAALHALPFDGRNFYLTEYVHLRDGQGLYHKQRIAVIDGEPVLRHAMYDSNWKIHSGSRAFMMARDSWEVEFAYFDRFDKGLLPPMRPAIDEITSRLQLEYYGIDCAMQPDGQMVVFEANANMNFLYNPYDVIQYRVDVIVDRLHKMLTRHSGERVI